jgi:hypothetical protein
MAAQLFWSSQISYICAATTQHYFMTVWNYVHILYLISQQHCHIFCQFIKLLNTAHVPSTGLRLIHATQWFFSSIFQAKLCSFHISEQTIFQWPNLVLNIPEPYNGAMSDKCFVLGTRVTPLVPSLYWALMGESKMEWNSLGLSSIFFINNEDIAVQTYMTATIVKPPSLNTSQKILTNVLYTISQCCLTTVL